jgi:hypothetical protein
MPAWIESTDSHPEDEGGKGKPRGPYNNVKGTESGHYMEMDDTPNNERVRIQHRFGSFQEYQATGNVVHKVVGQNYLIVIKDNNVSISGSCYVTIMGDSQLEVRGDAITRVLGDAKVNVTGDCDVTVKGDLTTTSEGDTTVNGTDIYLSPTGTVYVDSDLDVRGTIKSHQSISAFGNITAGGHLGVQGSVNIVGGIPQQGGPILPHIITGIALTSNMTGAHIITSGAATTLTSGAITTITAGTGVIVTGAFIKLN